MIKSECCVMPVVDEGSKSLFFNLFDVQIGKTGKIKDRIQLNLVSS